MKAAADAMVSQMAWEAGYARSTYKMGILLLFALQDGHGEPPMQPYKGA
jgi:hypothetical protein